MILRRLLVVVVVVVFAVVGIVVSRHQPERVAAAFGNNDQPPMPIAPSGDALTTTWFCPGVPAATDGSTGSGAVHVLNPSDQPMAGTVTLYPVDGDPTTQALQVGARSQAQIVPKDVAPGAFTGVLIEVYGTNAVVSETTTTKLGTVTSPCSTTASATWYLADGVTTVDANYDLLILNPFPDDAIVDITFAADDGPRQPTALQGYVVKGRSLRVVKVDDVVQRDDLVSASVVARNGRVVVGRYQTLADPPRKGLVAGLGSPSAGTTWLFANGQKGDGVTERVVLYNPTGADASVDLTVFPASAGTGNPVPLHFSVPSGQRADVNLTNTDEVPAGRHSITVRSSDQPIVAERILDLATKEHTATTVQAGSRVAAGSWYVPVGVPGGWSNALTVSNATGVDATVNVDSLGVAGEVPVNGLESVAVPAGSTVQMSLSDHGVGDQPVVVMAPDSGIVVEQFTTPPANQSGASSALGVPVAGTILNNT